MTRYLSVCSGIEAATIAWQSLGWQPVPFAEIEPFPCAVLAHHYQDVPNLGDMTAINGSAYRGTVDLIVGGTPCQSFSVAGKRGGISDPRGALALAFVELVRDVSPRLSNAGILSRGECLTLNTSECPSAAVESTLSDILETGDLPRRFFLSRTACAGILRRAEKRRRTLPEPLRQALHASGGDVGGGSENIVCIPINTQIGLRHNVLGERTGLGIGEQGAPAYTLQSAHSHGVYNHKHGVRRLTPLECEHLQGFPDHYTAITYKGKPAADGPRYKALGNSMAVPVMRWIGERIAAVSGGVHCNKTSLEVTA